MNPSCGSTRPIGVGSRRVLMRLKTLIALSLLLAPALAFARPSMSGPHMRPQVVRNRVPKAHVHEVGPHH